MCFGQCPRKRSLPSSRSIQTGQNRRGQTFAAQVDSAKHCGNGRDINFGEVLNVLGILLNKNRWTTGDVLKISDGI